MELTDRSVGACVVRKGAWRRIEHLCDDERADAKLDTCLCLSRPATLNVMQYFLFLLATCNALKVTVVGGSGFVGSRVCEKLISKGAEVTSVSKTGRAPSAEPWTSSVSWRAVDLLNADEAAIDSAIGSPDAIISCVGVVDSDKAVLKQGNGAANAETVGINSVAVMDAGTLIHFEAALDRHDRASCCRVH